MQNIVTAVIAVFIGALLGAFGYHVFVGGPRLRALRRVLDVHDELLGGGNGARATDRLGALEHAMVDATMADTHAGRRLDALETIARRHVPRIGFVRYNAFSDVGSDLSYALALLNSEGDGVVLSSIYSREETRTYGKAVTGFTPAQDPSSEELAAIAKVRAASS